MLKKISKIEIVLTVTVITVIALFLKGPLSETERDNLKNQPPSFNIFTSKYMGNLDANSCLSLGQTYTQDEVDAYTEPAFDADERTTLAAGLHLYHSAVPYTMGEIMNFVAPNASNRVFIVYYTNGDDGKSEGFHIYPALPDGTETDGSTTEVHNVVDASSFAIPANTGFSMYSCLDAGFWKISSESDAPDSFKDISSAGAGWHLLPVPTTDDPASYLDSVKDRVSSAWAQTGESFTFAEDSSYTDVDSIEMNDGYNMLWIQLDEASATEDIPANSNDASPVDCVEPEFSIDECYCNFPLACVEGENTGCYTCEDTGMTSPY